MSAVSNDWKTDWKNVPVCSLAPLGGPVALVIALVLAVSPTPSWAQETSTSPLFSPLSGLSGASSLAPLLAPVESIPQSPTGPILASDADKAIRGGYGAIGRQLMLAHLVAEYDGAAQTLRSTKFSPLLKRPVWNIPCGFSIAVRGDVSVTTFSPIKSSGQSDSSTTGARAQVGGGNSEFDNAAASGSGLRSPGSDTRSGEGSSTRSLPTRSVGPTLDPSAASFLVERLGAVAEVFLSEFKQRYQSGTFGPLLTSVTPSPSSFTVVGDLADTLSAAPEPLPMLDLGLTYLGEGASADTLNLARANHLELLFHIDMTLKQGRGDAVQNVSRIRLYDVATGKSLVVSKTMDNREALRASSGTEYVQTQLSSLWRVIDRDIKAVDLPLVGSDVIDRRIGSLLIGDNAKTLQTLAEIRLYQSFGVIDEAKMQQAFFIAGGAEAMTMLHGSPKERLKVARQWAVESAQPASSDR